jgi:hypothetical protein
LPWSTWPIVPTFTWGLVRSNLPFAMALLDELQWLAVTSGCGAHERNRTFDLLLTKEVLYRLSYVSVLLLPAGGRRDVNGAGDGDRTRTISLEG